MMHQSAPCVITNLPPRQPQEASPAPAPTPSYPAHAPSTGPDAVGILSVGARAIVEVTLGSTKVAMLIDTGAVEMSLTPKVAQRLLNAGEAHYTGQTSTFTMANGTTSSEQEIVIDKLQIGAHTLYGVSASIRARSARSRSTQPTTCSSSGEGGRVADRSPSPRRYISLLWPRQVAAHSGR